MFFFNHWLLIIWLNLFRGGRANAGYDVVTWIVKLGLGSAVQKGYDFGKSAPIFDFALPATEHQLFDDFRAIFRRDQSQAFRDFDQHLVKNKSHSTAKKYLLFGWVSSNWKAGIWITRDLGCAMCHWPAINDR